MSGRPADLESVVPEQLAILGTETTLMASPGLAIHLLGGFRVTVGSRAIDEQEWSSRRARSLVKLLALAPHHRLHREQIMERLWPEMDLERSANNLHKVLHLARR